MKRFTRGVAVGTCAALMSCLVAMPAAAGPNPPAGAAPAPRLITTLSPATLSSLAPAVAPEQETGRGDAISFFKTKKGALVLVLMGAGLSYTLYSKFHDRVKSPIRYP